MASLARLAATSAATLLFLSLAGCIDYDEVLELASDGSGHLTVDLTVDMTFYVEKVKPLLPKDVSEDAEEVKPFTKEEIEKDCQAKGVTVTTCEVTEDKAKNRSRLKLALDWKDLDALRSIRRFSDRELEFEEKGDDLLVTYKVDPRSAIAAKGFDLDPPKSKDETDEKIAAAIDDARKASRGRFTLKLPGKVSKTNGTAKGETSARWVVDRNDEKTLAAVAKEPLTLTATFPAKDARFLEKERERKKKAAEKADPDKKKPDQDGE